MKTSYVRMGVILFPLLLALMVNQVQGECDSTSGKLSFQKNRFWFVKALNNNFVVTRCLTDKNAKLPNMQGDKKRACVLLHEIFGCVDSCSEEEKQAFNSILAVSKIHI